MREMDAFEVLTELKLIDDLRKTGEKLRINLQQVAQQISNDAGQMKLLFLQGKLKAVANAVDDAAQKIAEFSKAAQQEGEAFKRKLASIKIVEAGLDELRAAAEREAASKMPVPTSPTTSWYVDTSSGTVSR